MILDQLAFDADEAVFVDDFMFLLADDIKYPELEQTIANGDFNGVIGFNRFGFDHKQRMDSQSDGMKGKTNIIRAMIEDLALANYTV